jgi:hypothetical protein
MRPFLKKDIHSFFHSSTPILNKKKCLLPTFPYPNTKKYLELKQPQLLLKLIPKIGTHVFKNTLSF